MIKVKNIDQEYTLKEVFDVAAFNKDKECIYKNLFCSKLIFKTEQKNGEKYNTIVVTNPVGRISDALKFVFDDIHTVEFTSIKRMCSTGKDLPIKLIIIPEDIEVWFECSTSGEPLQYYTKFYFKTINEE